MKYKNAPIREAVFDIKVSNPNTKGASDLLAIKENVLSFLPVLVEKKNMFNQINFSIDPNVPPTSTSQSNHVGYIFKSTDDLRQLQVNVDGITFNILKPYEEWETHFDFFFKIWKLYNSNFQPQSIIKFSTRFINRLEIPKSVVDLEEYLNYLPKIPSNLPQGFNSFFVNINVPLDQNRIVIINETIEMAEQEYFPLILDIDVIQNVGSQLEDDVIYKNFSDIRVIKNDTFENCITEKTRGLFI